MRIISRRGLAGGLAILSSLHLTTSTSNSTCVIPAFGDGQDDAPAITQAFSDCKSGGNIIFSENTTYNVQSQLALHNLSNVQIDFHGRLLYSTDVRYWVQHGSYYWFQNISAALQISGENITFDGHNTGVIDGQGQVWYDLTQAVGGYYGRPIPFSLRGVTNAVVKGFSIINSQKWNVVIVESKNVLVDNIYLSSTSDDDQANPGNLGNTDGFDTINSDNITFSNSYANTGDDCVSVKYGSTNIFINNLTCVNTAGIAIGSLGQYEGLYDYVENVTATDVTLIGSRNGAYIKTWLGKSRYYPPQGGGNGTGRVSNVAFRNFRIENITAAPVLLQQCSTWAGDWNVPNCTEYPSRGFTFNNISWQNFNGWMNEKVATTSISLACSPYANCTGFEWQDINVTAFNGSAGIGKCTNVDGYDKSCDSIA